MEGAFAWSTRTTEFPAPHHSEFALGLTYDDEDFGRPPNCWAHEDAGYLVVFHGSARYLVEQNVSHGQLHDSTPQRLALKRALKCPDTQTPHEIVSVSPVICRVAYRAVRVGRTREADLGARTPA